MLKNGLTTLLILLLASQSVWAMADVYQSHQSDSEHYISEHHHGHDHHSHHHGDIEDKQINNDLADQSSTEELHADHHHCHGTQPHFFLSSINIPVTHNTNSLYLGYKPIVGSAPLSNLFRPPRA